jgi:hypothetical protein
MALILFAGAGLKRGWSGGKSGRSTSLEVEEVDLYSVDLLKEKSRCLIMDAVPASIWK